MENVPNYKRLIYILFGNFFISFGQDTRQTPVKRFIVITKRTNIYAYITLHALHTVISRMPIQISEGKGIAKAIKEVVRKTQSFGATVAAS